MSPLDLIRHIDEEIDRRLQDLMRQGDIAIEEGTRLRDQLISHGNRLQESFWPSEPDLENLLKQQGIPTREEYDTLNQQLDALTAKLDALLSTQAESKDA